MQESKLDEALPNNESLADMLKYKRLVISALFYKLKILPGDYLSLTKIQETLQESEDTRDLFANSSDLSDFLNSNSHFEHQTLQDTETLEVEDQYRNVLLQRESQTHHWLEYYAAKLKRKIRGRIPVIIPDQTNDPYVISSTTAEKTRPRLLYDSFLETVLLTSDEKK